MSLPPPDLPVDPEPEPRKAEAGLPAPSEQAPEMMPGAADTTRPPAAEASAKKDAETTSAPDASQESAGERAPALDAESAVAMIQSAFRYPMQENGWKGLMPLWVLAVVIGIGGMIPFVNIVVLILGWGYAVAFLFRVIETTVKGEDGLPKWPEVSNLLDDIVLPAFQMVVVLVLSNSVGIVLGWMGLGATEDAPGFGFADFVGMAAFSFYYPMAVLALVHFGSLRSTLPDLVIPAIQRAIPGYWVAVGVVFLLLFLNVFVGGIAGSIPLLGGILHLLVTLYLLVVMGRILGMVFLQNRKVIGW